MPVRRPRVRASPDALAPRLSAAALVALAVRRRRGVRALVMVMVITGIIMDTDAQFHLLTMLGSAGYDSTTIWAQVVATTVAYAWFPESTGQRALQFISTVLLCLFLAGRSAAGSSPSWRSEPVLAHRSGRLAREACS